MPLFLNTDHFLNPKFYEKINLDVPENMFRDLELHGTIRLFLHRRIQGRSATKMNPVMGG